MERHDNDRRAFVAQDRFIIRGILQGQPVHAVWTPDLLVGAPALLVVAEAVIAAAGGIDGGTIDVLPSWSSLPGAALALIHAVDRLVAAEVTSNALQVEISSDDS